MGFLGIKHFGGVGSACILTSSLSPPRRSNCRVHKTSSPHGVHAIHYLIIISIFLLHFTATVLPILLRDAPAYRLYLGGFRKSIISRTCIILSRVKASLLHRVELALWTLSYEAYSSKADFWCSRHSLFTKHYDVLRDEESIHVEV